MPTSPDQPGISRGYVIPIGGAEERSGPMPVLSRFVELSGAGTARIAIIPTASTLPDTGEKYVDIFKQLGVSEAIRLDVLERADGERDDLIDKLNSATGIFLTGGNQLRISTILGGTAMAQAIRRLNANGVHVAGTSAGAAIMPEHMIAGGNTGNSPSTDMVTLAPGLGLTNAFLIDQHFTQRDRLGRLLTAISYNPFLTGLGIDEDTAVIINPGVDLEVVGSGTVTVLDPADLSYSSMGSAGKNNSLTLLNLKLHILSEGCRYKIANREALPPA